MTRETVIVVGGGPAGLAVAAELQRAGVRAIVLDKSDAVGASWRDRYDRLRLNSARPFSTLPGARFARGTDVFPSRDDVVRYLRDYAARHALDVRLGTTVERIDRDGAAWTVRTSEGEMHARHVVVAGGANHRPRIPAWPGREEFAGDLRHAAQYREPGPYRGRDVLVVGAGSTGIEIAYDLVAGGAARVRMAVRTPPNMLMRAPAGVPLARLLFRLPPRRADAIVRLVRRRTIGDLSAHGLPIPEDGLFTRLRRDHVTPTLVDPPTIEAIRDGRLEIVAGVDALDRHGVRLADGAYLRPDAVIAATGYTTGLEPLVGHLGVLDEHGAPRVVDGEAAPGLRFVGYVIHPGQLGHFGAEARRAARAIKRAAPRRPAPLRPEPAVGLMAEI
jgi:cation diffusion facilitator CzcD-associated flavoprotein CzcO